MAEMPTFADMQASLARRGLHQYASQYNPGSSFADEPLPLPPSHQSYHTSFRDSSGSSSMISSQFNLYIPEKSPEKDTLVSPVSGDSKGQGGVVSPVEPSNPMKPLGLFNGQPKAFLTPVDEKSEHNFSFSGGPGTSIHPPSSVIHHNSAIASSMALIPEPLKTPKSGKSSSRSGSPRSLPAHNPFNVRTPSPRMGEPSFDTSTLSSYGSSRARSPLIDADQPPQPSPTPSTGNGGKLFLPPQRKKSLRDRLGGKGPPNINVAAVNEAQPHASLTSLPGLINRALNMANNIEQGKTSSKQSDWFGNDLISELAKKGQKTASLGQVLEGFTFSPAVVQREGGSGHGFDGVSHTSRTTTSMSEKFNQIHPQMYSQHNRYASDPPHLSNRSRSKYDHRGGPRRRRVCGMPLWLFIALLAGTVTIVALAIALPLALLGGKKSPPADPADCAASHPCENRGASVAGPNGTCSCVCVDNFTGFNCAKANNAASCGSVQTSTKAGATVGSDLVSLLNNGESQFLVPLNASAVLPIFSTNNLTCDMENALVSVGSSKDKEKRSHTRAHVKRQPGSLEFEEQAAATLAIRPRTTAAPIFDAHLVGLAKRQHNNNAVTANGILIAGGNAGGDSPSSTTDSPSPTSTSDSQDSSPTVSSSSEDNKRPSKSDFNPKSASTLTFAKTAILYTLQVSQDMSVAIAAQSAMQAFLTSPKSGNAEKVDVGGGFVVDFVGGSIKGEKGGDVGMGVDRAE